MGANNKTVVLVHGGFVDGSGWRAVYDELTRDGISVRVVQNPTKSLADDAATTRQILDDIDGEVVLVGHSYGGAVITEAGTHDKVAALVYVTAFAPDKGESVNTLIAGFPKTDLSPRSWHLSRDTCSSTGRSSANHLPGISPRRKRRSWPIPKFRGAWTRSAGP